MTPHAPEEQRDRSDESLLRGHVAGERGALEMLLARHEKWLTTWFSRHIPSDMRRRVSAEDLLQETWIVVARQAPLFQDRGEGSFRAWVRAIAQTKLKESMRHHLVALKRDGGREVTRPERQPTEGFASPDASPSAHAMGRELADAIARAAARLRPEDREVIRLVQTQGMPLDEAAIALGRTREATRKLLERALARFARRVDEERGRA
jgi:RNA polymerase sigma-70 factor (subfamily 1)